jgi:hypothetical protein
LLDVLKGQPTQSRLILLRIMPIATTQNFIWADILFILIILAIFAVPAGIVLLILRFVTIRRRTPPSSPADAEPTGSSKSYEGIGGWLIWVAIILVRAPIAITVTLFRSVFPLLRHDTWTALTEKNSEAYHPLWAPVIVSELVFNILFLALILAGLVLFFRRRRSFPKFMIFLCLMNLVWEVSLGLVSRQIPTMDDDSSNWSFVDAIGAALACAIWIPYFKLSKRVRATFTH